MIFGFLFVAAVAFLLSLVFSRHDEITPGPTLPSGWWLLIPALAVQVLWRRWLSTTAAAPEWIWILSASYLPLLAFLWLNRRAAWVWLVGLGTVLNLTAMALNGGGMPAPVVFSASAAAQIGAAGGVLPYSKDRFLDPTTSRVLLAPLGDRLTVVLPGGIRSLFSVGDLFILAGGFLAMATALGIDFAAVRPRMPRAREGVRRGGGVLRPDPLAATARWSGTGVHSGLDSGSKQGYEHD